MEAILLAFHHYMGHILGSLRYEHGGSNSPLYYHYHVDGARD